MTTTSAEKILASLDNDDAAAALTAFNHAFAMKLVDRVETARQDIGQSMFKGPKDS